MIKGSRKTLIDHLIEIKQGFPLENPKCEHCDQRRHPIEMLNTVGLPGIPPGFTGDFICSHCVTDQERSQAANQPIPIDLRWNSIRAQRNLLIAQHQWAISEASPLSAKSKTAFIDYIKALHRVTIDFAMPELVVWPTIPPIQYG